MAQIYLISPPQINLEIFAKRLENILATGFVPAFQLRLKDYKRSQVKEIAITLNKICKKHNCLFILNDDYKTAIEIGADGVHIGLDDGLNNISQIRQQSPNGFVIGASCYDSKDLAITAGNDGANYVSFGAFYESKTKKSRGKPTLDLLKWAVKYTNLSIVAIGGINDKNAQDLVKAGADLLAVISYIWDHPDGDIKAISILSKILSDS